MADHVANPLQLQWGRQPSGKFTIAVVAVIPTLGGKTQTVPIRIWGLTKDEEEKLKTALHGGLLIASAVPNGHEGP